MLTTFALGRGSFRQFAYSWLSRPRCVLLVLAGLAGPQRAQAACGGPAVLTGSCFEGGDGNLTADGGLTNPDNTDWATTSDETLSSDPTSPGTEFGNSSDEQNPTSWTLNAGEPSTNKLDITAAATRLERIGSDIWMHVGFTMRGAAGSSNVLIELNSAATPGGANPFPVRSAGDALIQFSGNAGMASRIGLCRWVGNQFGQGPGGSPAYGWYTTPLPGSLITSSNKDCTQVSGGGNPLAIGKVNSGVVLNNLQDETQSVAVSGAGGTFTLSFNGQTTIPIARNASASTVQSALEGLSNIAVGDVAVSGSNGGPFTVRFTGAYASSDVSQMTAAGFGRRHRVGLHARPGRLGQLPAVAALRLADDRRRSLRRALDQPHGRARPERLEPVLQLRQRLAPHLQRQLDLVDHGRLRRSEAGHRRRVLRGVGRQEGRGQPELRQRPRPIRRPTTRARRPTRARRWSATTSGTASR